MIKFKTMWTFVLLFALVACSQNEDFNKEDFADQKDRPLVQLTAPEYLSVAYDGENELSSEAATKILQEFISTEVETRGTSSNDLNLTVSKEYYLNATVTRSNAKTPIKIVEFVVGNKTRANSTGFASVVADKRYPNVIAYAPKGDINEIDQYGAGLMMKRAKSVAQHHISTIENYKDSLREKTIDKIRTRLDFKDYSFENIKNSLVVEQPENKELEEFIKTRGSAITTPPGVQVASIGPLVNQNLQWIQGAPQNLFIEKCSAADAPYWDEMFYGGRYPAGCTAVAAATILTYVKPTIYCSNLGRNANWNTALSNVIIDFWSNETEPYVIESAAILKEVSYGISTKFSAAGGSASAEAVQSYFSRIGVKMGGRSALTYFTIRPSIGAYKPVLLTGASRNVGTRADYTTGRHAWVMDGIKIMQRGTRQELQQFNNYGFCHFGWVFGSGNGWYLFDANGSISFQYGSDLYDMELAAYPNISK